MYRLIIVDDEEEIREGLRDLIDWPDLGFEVVSMFRDGKDAIRYLQEHEVDVVLTDIKMTYASGIDLAEYVYSQKLPVKVVILSGFREFQLAREAIRYNVSHYLLKPTDIEEVSEVFRKISEELDQDKLYREQEQRERQHVKMLRPLLMEQFFSQLLRGGDTVRGGDDWKKQLHLLGLPADAPANRCCLFGAEWSEASETGGKSSQDRCQAISVTVTKEREQIQYSCIHLDDRRFTIIGNALTDMTEELLQKRSEQYFLYIQGALSSLLGLSVKLEHAELYPSLSELIERKRRDAAVAQTSGVTGETVADEPQEDERMIIRQAKRYFEEHFKADPSMTEVAGYVGLNPVYFSRLFKQETGQTYSDYCIDIRMKRAMQYLKDPKYKVYEIGFLIGYKNTKYFHKLFKRHTGHTPSEYRDRL
ncbi:response regulator [Paenibacillus oryzisoli]|uniref:response regulator transcription factor n=1 Tax=Paenibacillus oryzisoli TaxID=1850517 RepID=UPI003D28EE03